MKTIHDLLNDADPLRHESPVVEEQRIAARAALVTEKSAEPRIIRPPRLRAAPLTMSVRAIAAVLGILVLGALLWPRMGFETHARVRFEVRLAEDRPAPGLIEATVSGTDRTIYLHPEIVLSNEDVVSASVSKDSMARTGVSLHFTPEGTKKILAAGKQHIGKPMAILIDGVVVMAPTLRENLSDRAMITGMTESEAERIVNGMK